MAPVLLNPSRFGAGGGGSAAYDAAVLADSPVVYAPLDVYSSGFLDASGNNRHLDVVSGTAPTATAGGPGSQATAAEWGTSAGHVHTTYSMAQPTIGCYEFWIYLHTNPAANLVLTSWSANSGSAGCCSMVWLLTSGKIRLQVWQGAFASYDAASALTLDAWHHVAAKWDGTSGAKVRIDGADAATGGNITAASPGASSFRLHGQYNGAGNTDQTGAVKLARAAFYSTRLSDARTDAHLAAA